MPQDPRKWTPAAIVAVGLLAAITPRGEARAQTAAPAPAAASASIHALGRLEPETGLITIGARPGQRIDEIRVAIGDDVEAGQVLAILEGRAQAEAQLALAELQKRQMEFQRQAKAEAAATVADALRKLLDRATPLYKVGDAAASLAPGTVDKARLEDEGKYVELLAKTAEAELNRKLLDAGSGPDANEAAPEGSEKGTTGNPEFLLPDAQIALAKAGLEQTEVKAPRAGKVLDVMAHAGEVGSGQLLLLGDVSRMVAVAEVFQSDVPRVRVGDAATVRILDRSVPGKVTRIGSVVGRNQAASMDPRALKDVRVVKVWVALDDPEFAARLVNMEAEVVIAPSGGA
ncbi:HlyD family efflux transporter periplasmic adaptor subunit [Paludisphaera sp.]|uniref:HlyD family efflux transporter periplasmic adaptor subunit n=1 Tax=Paludisphaera sp. TaxID=2017432 RepID=UPI00301D7E69